MGTDEEGTYENMIGKEWSRFVLDKLQPDVVFSGDDHDHCHHLHQRAVNAVGGASWDVPELTVNAMSLTSGVKTPGYARLSIWQEPPVAPVLGSDGVPTTLSHPGQTKVSYAACALPRQIENWATYYPVLIILVALYLPLHRRWFQRGQIGKPHSGRGLGDAGSSTIWDAGEHLPMQQTQRRSAQYSPRRRSSNDLQLLEEVDAMRVEAKGEEEATAFLAPPASGSGEHGRRGYSPSSPLATGWRAGLGRGSKSRLPPGVMQWWRDFRDVAWVPALYWFLLMLFGF